MSRQYLEKYGPTALVAGASEGLGRAFSTELARRGFHLVLVARRQDKLDALAEQLRRDHSATVKTVAFDLARQDLPETFAPILADHDVGLVVYNACATAVAPFHTVSLEKKETIVAVNVAGLTRMCHTALAHLYPRGRGGLLLMSSMAGFQGQALVTTYAATKAYTTVLGEGLWAEARSKGVDVHVCAAGAISTPNFDAITPESKRSAAYPMTPDAVALRALDGLGYGPTRVAGRLNSVVHFFTRHLFSRKRASTFMSSGVQRVYGDS